MSDEVGDRPIDLVPDAREHRHVHRGDRACDGLSVEDSELVAAAAAAHDDDCVERAPRERRQCAHDRLRRLDALHAAVGDRDVPREAARFELVHEVGVRRALAARHDADAEWHRSEHQAAVSFEQALAREEADEPVAILGKAAQRVGGVDSGHAQVDLAPRFVELDPAPDAHLEAVLEPHAVLGEMALDGFGDRAEQRDPQRHAFVAHALDEVEVEVARRRAAERVDLAADPHLLGKALAHGRTDRPRELAHAERGRRIEVEVERRLAHGVPPYCPLATAALRTAALETAGRTPACTRESVTE